MSREFNDNFWENFRAYLLNITNNNTRNDRVSYAKKYYCILATGNASELLTLNNDKRIHAMKAISSLSKFLGCYEKWKQIIYNYQLKWSNENNLLLFNDIWNNKANYGSMISWIKDTYDKLPTAYGNILIYCTLTGLRPEEACMSIQLIQNEFENYVNKDTMIAEHFKYPKKFMRRTKKAYISILTNASLEIAKNSGVYSYDAIKTKVKRESLDMRMAYCRKVFATHLRMNGIEVEIIDMLQGRIPKSVFVRHYFRPDMTNNRIRNTLDSLQKEIIS